MSDNGKWWKAWTAALDDAELEDLSIHEWFCWVRFGMYMKVHGNGGKIVIKSPAKALLHVLRLDSWDALVKVLKSFPHYQVNETANETVTGVSSIYVKCENWNKYQGDYSYQRVKDFRERKHESVTVNETVMKRSRNENETAIEEMRREEKIQEKNLLDSSSLEDKKRSALAPAPAGPGGPTPSLAPKTTTEKVIGVFGGKVWEVEKEPTDEERSEVHEHVKKFLKTRPTVLKMAELGLKMGHKISDLTLEEQEALKQAKTVPKRTDNDEDAPLVLDMTEAPSGKPGNF